MLLPATVFAAMLVAAAAADAKVVWLCTRA
jgi:hypothetical protein